MPPFHTHKLRSLRNAAKNTLIVQATLATQQDWPWTLKIHTYAIMNGASLCTYHRHHSDRTTPAPH